MAFSRFSCFSRLAPSGWKDALISAKTAEIRQIEPFAVRFSQVISQSYCVAKTATSHLRLMPVESNRHSLLLFSNRNDQSSLSVCLLMN